MVARVTRDRVKDTSTAQSGSTITLSGTAPTGYQSFNTGWGDGNFGDYTVTDGTNWEVQVGQSYTNSTKVLTRGTPSSSSNGGAQVVTFSGTVSVFGDLPASVAASLQTQLQGTRGFSNAYLRPSLGVQSFATGIVTYVPIYIAQSFSSVIINYFLYSPVSGTSTVDVGLYDNLAGAPNSRLGQQTGINTGTGSATGNQATSAINMASAKPPGIYWVAIVVHTAAPSLKGADGSGGNLLSGGIVDVMGLANAADVDPIDAWFQTSATLPSTAGSLSTAATAGIPLVVVRASL